MFEDGGEEPKAPDEKPGSALTDLDIYYVYRKYIEHQDNLVNQRLTRLFIAHASLAAVPGVIISRPASSLSSHLTSIVILFSVLGIVMCLIQAFAINAGLSATKCLSIRWKETMLDGGGEKKDGKGLLSKWSQDRLPGIVGGGKPGNFVTGRTMTMCAPLIPGIIWIAGLVSALYGKWFVGS